MKQGLSLMETVISCFLLTGVILLSVRLFHTGLGYTTRVHQRIQASLVASEQLEALREAALTPGGYAGLADSTTSVDGFRVEVRVRDATVDSPNSSLESLQAARRRLGLKRVRVQVAWASQRLVMVSLIGEPPRPVGRVEVTPAAPPPGSLPAGQPHPYRARLLDASDQEIPDVTFHWTVEPPGRAYAEFSRDGRTCQIYNRVYRMDGTWTTTGGPAVLRAWARYNGARVTGDSAPLQMSSP